jgi:hypothetical protein
MCFFLHKGTVLDECSSTTGTPFARTKILDFLGDLVGSNHPNLFVCITSGSEQDLNTVRYRLALAMYRVALHEEGGHRADIDSHIRYFINADREMKR